MTTKAMKIWGTTVRFNGNLVGEITDVGKAGQSRKLISVFSCDSASESMEYLSSGIERGQLTLGIVFDGEVGGTDATLQTAFDADTSGTLLITYKNGATKSITARVISLETAGGAADGGYAQENVTFQLSGALTNTPAAAT